MTAHNPPLFEQLWDYGDPAATERRLRDLLPNAKDSSYTVQLHTQIARTFSLRSQFDEAHTWLDRAQAHLGAEMPIAQIRIWLERGRTYNSANRKDVAIPLFEAAYELANQIGAEYFAVDAAHMLGIAHEITEQLVWNMRALALASSSDNWHVQQWQGPLYNNIGWTLHDAGNYELALGFFIEGLDWREQMEPDNLQPIYIARWCVARALRSLARYEESLIMQRKLLAEWEEPNNWAGYIQEEIGECLLALGQAAEAQPYFAVAYRLLAADGWLATHEPERLQRLQELSRTKKVP